MKNDKQLKKAFRKTFLVYFLLSIMPSTILLTVFARYISFWNQQQMVELNQNVSENGIYVLDSVIREIELYAISLSNNTDVIAYISSDGSQDFMEKCQKHLKSYNLINRYIEEGYIVNFSANEAVLSHGKLIELNKDNLLSRDREYVDNETRIQFFRENDVYPYLMRISRAVPLENNYGAVIMDINIENLGQLFNSYDSWQSGTVYLTTRNGSIIYSNQMKKHFGQHINNLITINESNTVIIDDLHYAVSMKSSKYYDINFLSLIPIDQTSSIRNTYSYLLLFSAIVLLIISSISAFYVTKRSISPILMILSAVEQKEHNKLLKIPLEIRYVINNIISKVKSNELSETELSIRLLLLKIAHVQALEAQINPHFLRNTLDSINWMAFQKIGKNNDVSRCLGKLSEMFWSGFRINEYIVALSDEFHHAEVYSELLTYDNNSKIEVVFNIPVELHTQKTVKFALQPLIENAVNHGIKPKRIGGKVWINARRLADELVITIEDDGVGMEKKDIEKLNNALQFGLKSIDEELRNIIVGRCEVLDGQMRFPEWSYLKPEKKGSGLGITNVNNRIKLIFGEKFGLEVYENKPQGLVILIRQPLE